MKNPLLKFVISIITMNKHFDIYKTWSPAILMLILKLDWKMLFKVKYPFVRTDTRCCLIFQIQILFSGLRFV